MSGYSPILELGDDPLTPREKVELKPCPFCGDDAVSVVPFKAQFGGSLQRAQCACGVTGPCSSHFDVAAEAWNRRTALASGSGDHAELARLAEVATPGPWFETEGHPSGRAYGIHAEAGPVVVFRGIAMPHGQGEHNAAFIATANPATVLALLAEIAALRAEMVEWRPIETAPRDGTVILGWSSFFPKRRPVEVAWDPDRYARKPVPRWVARDAVYGRRAFIDHPLTHWLPLPPAPGAEDE